MISTYDYYGVGDESSFTLDGADLTPNTARDVRGKTIYGAFKDGENFNVLLTGAFNPLIKQVRYTASTGLFEWSVPFEPSEHALIQFY